MAKWIKPNGAKVTTNDDTDSLKAALAAGWEPDNKKVTKKKVSKKKAK